MLVNTQNKGINLYTKPIRDSISAWIEQDILVPDTKPDAMKIINVTVNPYVTDIEIMDNKIIANGKLNYFIIYRTNETNMGTRGLFVSLPYSQTLNVKGITKDMEVRVKPIIKNIIYSLPNERKIASKTEVIFKVVGFKKSYVQLIENFDPEDNIQVKLKECKFNNILCNKYNIIASREDIMIPKENEDFLEILKVQPVIQNTEYKDSYNKVMVKGDIHIELLYLTDNEDTEIKKLELEVPFSGMIEMENINERSKFDIEFVINDFNIKPNTEAPTSKTMNVDYQIGVFVNMYEEEELTYVDDFYSENKELKYIPVFKTAVKDESIINKSIDIKEMLNNILPENTRLIDYTIDTSYIVLKQTGNLLHIEGNIKIGILTQNIDSLEIENKIIDVLVNEDFTLDDIKSDSLVSTDITIDKINISQNMNDLDIKLRLNLDIKTDNLIDLSIVDKIEEEELDLVDLDSMNIYIVKPNDTLWSIAKKYNTTVEKIVDTNEIVDSSIINVGQKILIIR